MQLLACHKINIKFCTINSSYFDCSGECNAKTPFFYKFDYNLVFFIYIPPHVAGHYVFALSRCPIVRPVVWPVPISARGQHCTLAIGQHAGQHAVRAGVSIHVPTWTRPQTGESIPVQKWKSPQGGQAPQMMLRATR